MGRLTEKNIKEKPFQVYEIARDSRQVGDRGKDIYCQ